ncbi:hypothetical protein BB559_003821 [Furculomyces boomerangus]|uniref:Uncharacterized protein n=2 Tax=Harpellales TaxID=61421 RepID=A0A2T9YIM5_9FUNG|nr:hypothetical protein BB559_003821 [Furculomyces boomerangus]PWA02836.1 hypothetical protein BB558_001013 [Smittium angustum]
MKNENFKSEIKLWLCRHGETTVNMYNCVQGQRINPPLNDRGRKQAEYLGEYFKNKSIDFIAFSVSERAKETAQAVAQYHTSAPQKSYKELVELEFGALEGKHVSQGYTDLIEKWDKKHEVYLEAPTGITKGESPVDCLKRLLPGIKDVINTCKTNDYKEAVLVVHSRVIQILMSYLVDKDLNNMARYKQGKAASNQLSIKFGGQNDKGGKVGERSSLSEFVDDEGFFDGLNIGADIVNNTEYIPQDVLSKVSSESWILNPQPHNQYIYFDVSANGRCELKQST